MKISDARYKANKKWNTENYEQMNLSVPKGTKDKYAKAAEAKGLSMTAYIVEAVEEKISREEHI